MSAIDGRKVHYRTNDKLIGLVMGDSYLPGHVRVHWKEPREYIEVHRVTDLVVLDRAKTQEELRADWAAGQIRAPQSEQEGQ